MAQIRSIPDAFGGFKWRQVNVSHRRLIASVNVVHIVIHASAKRQFLLRHSHSPLESVFATGGGYENHCSSHTVRKMGRGPAAFLAKPLHHLATNLAV